MKTVTAIIVLLVILVGGYFVITSQREIDEVGEEGDRVRGPESVAFAIGETKNVAGLSVTLDDVKTDSRCAKDVTCVWAGEVIAVVTLNSGDNEGTAMDVSTDKDPIEFAGYAISVVSVSPEPISTVQIEKADYVVTINVSAAAVGENI